MSDVLVEVRGIKEAVTLVNALEDFAKRETLGKVYSRGAFDHRPGRDYAPYVQEESQQAGLHRGFWHTDRQIAEDAVPFVVRILENAANELIKNNGRATVSKYITEVLKLLLERAQRYPAPRGGSYERTMSLHDSWTTELAR